MRIRVFLLPSSMPLTVHLCLLVTSALLLFLCSARLCLGSCPSNARCGDVELRYPFGKTGSGCGDPHFQFVCDSDHPDALPRLNINGNNYSILTSPFWGDDHQNTMKIVHDSIRSSIENLCGLPVKKNQSFWEDSPIFHLADDYIIVTFWKGCAPNAQSSGLTMINSFTCTDQWYYSSGPGSDSQGTSICETHFQIPIQNPYVQPNPTSPTSLSEGFEITWHDELSKSCNVCMGTKGSCGYNLSEPDSFLCYCPNGASYTGGKCPGNGGSKKAIIIGCSIGGAALIAIAVLFLRVYARRRKTLSRGLASGDMEAAMLPRREIGNLPIFSYEELQQATNCFHEENELGDGGFGSVYLGKLRDGRTVAVKRLYQDNSRRLEQFINEVKIFSTLNHPHVVRLYGCTSADSPELLLVYEFVPNGTLDDHLHGDRKNSNGLPWNVRLNIAIQTAEALAFLHSIDPPIFHRDVKSSNILLDENFDVKVADFGLCRIVPVNASHVTTAPQGTPGYVDPQYHQCYQLTEKSDVYSFGVVLVEIISAKLAVDINRNRNEIGLANMAKSKIQEGALHELVDPQLEIEANHELKVAVSAVAELAFRCLASERDGRPHMTEVAAQLREIKQSWDTSTDPGEQQWGSFSKSKQPLSPISVQDNWSSISSTPNISA